MKLSLAKDLGPLRSSAARRIDDAFERMARAVDPCPTLHAAKAREPGYFGEEAASRGMSAGELSALVAHRAGEAHRAILALESRRQFLKRRLAAADSEQAIAALLTESGA